MSGPKSEKAQVNKMFESNSRLLETIFELSPIGIAVVSLGDYRFIRVNQAFCDFLGHEANELARMTIRDVTHPEDVEKNIDLQQQLERQELPYFYLEKRFINKRKGVVYGALMSSLICDAKGLPRYFLGQVTDITANKQAASVLEKNRETIKENLIFQSILAQLRSCYPSLEELSLINMFMSLVVKMYGASWVWFGRISEGRVIDFESCGDIEEDIIHELLTRQPGAGVVVEEREVSIPLIVGEHTDGLFVIKNVKPGREYGLHIDLLVKEIGSMIELKRNRDHEKKLQQQMLHSAKLASIGELAAGIGHEINNPLMIIAGGIEWVAKSFENLDETTLKIISNQREAVKRIVNIVKGLRTYSRSDSDIIELVEIREVIEETLAFLQLIYEKDGIVIEKQYAAEEMFFEGNFGRFQQVLVNLFSNARDATAYLENRKIVIKTQAEGEKIRLIIADNGRGIPREDIAQIFNAFFTTKDKEKGTGIGLGIVKNIVENIHGRVELLSPGPNDTAFSILLPRSRIKRTDIKEVQDLEAPLRLSGRVLIVDDEEDIRDLLRYFMSEWGLEVTVAANGRDGLELARTRSFDVIVTDLNMPVMNGIEMIRCLHEEIKYSGKIFVITGVIKDLEHLKVDGFFMKPFVSKTIYQALFKILAPQGNK